MNLGFNETATRRESTYSNKQQAEGTSYHFDAQNVNSNSGSGGHIQDFSINTLMSPQK
jgi:hypothetical protein